VPLGPDVLLRALLGQLYYIFTGPALLFPAGLPLGLLYYLRDNRCTLLEQGKIICF